MQTKGWWRLKLSINQNLEDLIIWQLNQLDIFSYAFNYQTNKSEIWRLFVWLPENHWKKVDRDFLENKLVSVLIKNGYKKATVLWDFIPEENWLNSWKKYWGPEIIGKNFLVLPCWMQLPKEFENKTILTIDPGAAFGTGNHPSTSLCLEAMENTSFNRKKVLDVGCGSGILTIAACKLGAKVLHAIDNDYLAINSTEENFKINFDNLNSLTVFQGSFPDVIGNKNPKNYDVILCNILAEVIRGIIPDFCEILAKNGLLILSGILSTQKEEIIKILNLYHFKIDNVSSKKDWICIKASKEGFNN